MKGRRNTALVNAGKTIIDLSEVITFADALNEVSDNTLKATSLFAVAHIALPKGRVLKKEFNKQASLTDSVVSLVDQLEAHYQNCSGTEDHEGGDGGKHSRSLETSLSKRLKEFNSLNVTQSSPEETQILYAATQTLDRKKPNLNSIRLSAVAEVITNYYPSSLKL